MAIPKPCLICGRRVFSGDSRCEEHAGRRWKLNAACLTCGKTSRDGWCDEHRPAPRYAEWSEAERLTRMPWRLSYRDPLYRQNSKIVRARSRGRCERCGSRQTAISIDHKLPLNSGGTNELSNLWALCLTCHSAKTRADSARRRSRGV